MKIPTQGHRFRPDYTIDGGDLDWATGLRWLVERQLRQMAIGELLEILSDVPGIESAVVSWCPQSKNDYLSTTSHGRSTSILISHGDFAARQTPPMLNDTPPPRQIVRRLPPLALYCRQYTHPKADLGPDVGAGTSPIPTAKMLSALLPPEQLREEIHAAFLAEVQLVILTAPEITEEVFSQLSVDVVPILREFPPERLAFTAIETTNFVDLISMSLFTSGMGTVFVPDIAKLTDLKYLPVQCRLGLLHHDPKTLFARIMQLLEFLSIERLMIQTDQTDPAAISQMADIIAQIREQFHSPSTISESTY